MATLRLLGKSGAAIGPVRIVASAAIVLAACGHAGSGGTGQAPAAKGYSHLPATSTPPTASASPTSAIPGPKIPAPRSPPSPVATPTVVPPPQDPLPLPSPPVAPPTQIPDRPMALAGEGPRFAVTGVDPADVLYLRSAPGPKNPVVGQIPPAATGLVGTGAHKKVGPGEWREITYGGVRGWVNARFLVEESR